MASLYFIYFKDILKKMLAYLKSADTAESFVAKVTEEEGGEVIGMKLIGVCIEVRSANGLLQFIFLHHTLHMLYDHALPYYMTTTEPRYYILLALLSAYTATSVVTTFYHNYVSIHSCCKYINISKD